MLSLKDELPLWRHVSYLLDELAARGEELGDTKKSMSQTCPYCDGNRVLTEVMEDVGDAPGGLKIGFFTCTFCGETWSHRMDL